MSSKNSPETEDIASHSNSHGKKHIQPENKGQPQQHQHQQHQHQHQQAESIQQINQQKNNAASEDNDVELADQEEIEKRGGEEMEEEDEQEEEEDSIRYRLLLKVIDKALNKSIECLNTETLIKCYPSFNTKSGVKYLNNSIIQINNFFIKSSTKEINAILNEKGIKSKLASLDKIIQSAQENLKRNNKEDQLFIESLSHQYLVDYNMLLVKNTYHNQLQDKLNKLKSDNDDLISELKDVGKENHEMLGDLEEGVKQLKAIKDSLSEEDDDTKQFLEFDSYFSKLSNNELFA